MGNKKEKLRILTGSRFVFFLLISIGFPLRGQDLKSLNQMTIADFDKVYGVDFDLVNGKKYANFYGNATGHPFLVNPELKKGWIQLKGKKYDELKVNYDIYNQEVVVEYASELAGIQRYCPPDKYLEAFGIENRIFKKIKAGTEEEKIYEIISEGKYTVIYSHSKNYSVSKDVNKQRFSFSEDIVKKYFLEGDALSRFRSAGSFIKHFPEEEQTFVKDYLRKHRLSIKRADIYEMKKLMKTINEHSN